MMNGRMKYAIAKLGFILPYIILPCCLGQELLEGEFGDIKLGRELISPSRFPTVQEMRKMVAEPKMTTTLMLRMYRDENNHHLPMWSPDGQRLAFQRTNVEGATASKLLLYKTMSQPKPTLVTDREDTYDYMFRWGINSPQGFVFSRIDKGRQSTNIFVSTDGEEFQEQTAGAGQFIFPTLYERTDGIWRLIYQRDSDLVHDAWSGKGAVGEPSVIAQGTAPRWGRDGQTVLMMRRRSDTASAGGHDLVVRNLQTQTEFVLPSPSRGTLRSPVWSPNERQVAYYAREPGEASPWRIEVCNVQRGGAARVVGSDIVMNQAFHSEGPNWEPSGRRVWTFSHSKRKDAYYPLVAFDVATGDAATVDYPTRCTSPSDLAVNPVTGVPEIAFVGHDGVTQDLFVVFLNHY